MKLKLSLILFVILILISACGKSEGENTELKEAGIDFNQIEKEIENTSINKKYPIESGIITFEQTGVLGNNKIIVYFDNYGTKERNVIYDEENNIKEVKFSDGENMFRLSTLEDGSKVAYILGAGKYGTEMKFVADPFANNERRKIKYQYEELADMDIIGKVCQAYKTKSTYGTTVFAGCQNVLLYSKAETSMGTSETKAISFKENVELEDDLFKVPSDYKIKKN